MFVFVAFSVFPFMFLYVRVCVAHCFVGYATFLWFLFCLNTNIYLRCCVMLFRVLVFHVLVVSFFFVSMFVFVFVVVSVMFISFLFCSCLFCSVMFFYFMLVSFLCMVYSCPYRLVFVPSIFHHFCYIKTTKNIHSIRSLLFNNTTVCLVFVTLFL